jgi:hypothetical protein
MNSKGCNKYLGISAVHEKNDDINGTNGKTGNNKCLGCGLESVNRK